MNEHQATWVMLCLVRHKCECEFPMQVSATGTDAFSRRKTQSKVYWTTIPKSKRDQLQAAAAAAGTTVQVNEDGTAMVQTAATGMPTWSSSHACSAGLASFLCMPMN